MAWCSGFSAAVTSVNPATWMIAEGFPIPTSSGIVA
jgi:hypothetical protein